MQQSPPLSESVGQGGFFSDFGGGVHDLDEAHGLEGAFAPGGVGCGMSLWSQWQGDAQHAMGLSVSRVMMFRVVCPKYQSPFLTLRRIVQGLRDAATRRPAAVEQARLSEVQAQGVNAERPLAFQPPPGLHAGSHVCQRQVSGNLECQSRFENK